MSDYNFIIDIESRRLIADYFSTEAGTPPTVIFGDQPTVNVQLVESNNDNAEHPWKSVALTGQSIRIGVGSLEDATPSAYIELTADLAAASSVITEVRAGVLNTTNEIQRVQILDAVKGNYTITIAGETTTPLSLDASLEEITDAIEALASITADSVDVTGNPTDYRVEFDSSLADVGAITVNLDNITSRVGKTGTLDLHVEEILTLLDDETSVEATLEVVRWTTADVAGETVLQVPVTVKQDVIPDTVPGTTPLPGYATIDLDHINQSGAATGQVPSWNGSEWVPITASGTGDMLASVYDPTAVNADAFDMDNMVEGATNKILTAAERTKLGDQVLTDVIDKMAYNADDLTFDIDTGTGVVVQIGQELLVKARNVTGSTITNGSVVRINGASGDRPTITPAQADSLANISGIIGIVTADILNNAVGFVTVHGLVRGLDTSTFTEGDELFLSSSVAGGFTSTEPTLSIPIGTVTFANPASGTIFANVDNQKHLLEFASDPTLVGNFSAADWKTALAISAADVDFGTGTDSYVWTSDGAGGAAWEALSGGGDMLAATYDPTAVAGDAFAMDNMVEGATTKILTATERAEIAANTAASHAAVTVSDSAEIDLTLAGQDITASLIASSIDETKLDASVNASLDLADSASQPGHTHVASTDVVATGTPSSTTFLRGDDVWATPAGGGGGLTLTNKTADANITAVAGEMHVVEMNSGTPFTASRNWTLPVAASVSTGDQFGLMIKDGDAAFEVNVRTGATGDLLNGVDVSAASNEWELFQAGEVIIVTCIDGATGDYIVERDGRKAAKARVRRSTTAQTVANLAFDQIEFDTEDYSYGMTVDTTTGYNITVRRDGIYNLNSLLLFDISVNDVLINLYKNGSRVNAGFTSTDGGREGVVVFNDDIDLAAGDDVEIWTYAYGARSTSTNSVKSSYFSVSEIL